MAGVEIVSIPSAYQSYSLTHASYLLQLLLDFKYQPAQQAGNHHKMDNEFGAGSGHIAILEKLETQARSETRLGYAVPCRIRRDVSYSSCFRTDYSMESKTVSV